MEKRRVPRGWRGFPGDTPARGTFDIAPRMHLDSSDCRIASFCRDGKVGLRVESGSVCGQSVVRTVVGGRCNPSMRGWLMRGYG